MARPRVRVAGLSRHHSQLAAFRPLPSGLKKSAIIVFMLAPVYSVDHVFVCTTPRGEAAELLRRAGLVERTRFGIARLQLLLFEASRVSQQFALSGKRYGVRVDRFLADRVNWARSTKC